MGLKIGVDQPQTIKVSYLGEYSHSHPESENRLCSVLDIFDNQKPLLNDGKCLFRRDSKISMVKSSSEYYISRFEPKNQNLMKELFQFNLSPDKFSGYKEKIKIDKTTISSKLVKTLEFYQICQRLHMINYEPGYSKKLMPFVKADRSALIVGLIDLRRRVIPVKILISIYGLLADLEFKQRTKISFFNILNIHFSVELDLLVFDAWLNLDFRAENRDRVESTICTGSKEGVCRWKRGLFEEMMDGDDGIVEIQKLRFKVFNVLKRSDRRIKVETLGYQGNPCFRASQGTVTTFEEDSLKIRISMFSKNSQVQKKMPLRKQNQKTLKEMKEIVENVIEISKSDLFESKGIRSHGVWAAFIVDTDKLLVITWRELLLYDINSGVFVSSCKYSHNIPIDYTDTKIDRNIMVSSKPSLGIIEVFRICKAEETNQGRFEFLGNLDLSKIDENLFSIESLLAFKCVNDQVCELKMILSTLRSQECSLTTESGFKVIFELPMEECRQEGLRIISSSRSSELTAGEGLRRIYKKNQFWNTIFLNGYQTLVHQFNSVTQTEKVFSGFSRFYRFDHYFKDIHINDNKIYIEFSGESNRLIKLIEVTSSVGLLGLSTGYYLKKTLTRNISTKVYFDEVTDLFRIFVFEMSEKLMQTQFVILNEELDVVNKYTIPFLEDIRQFRVISNDYLHILGTEFSTVGDLNNSIDREGYTQNVSLIINLAGNTYKRLVVEGEGPLFGTPFYLGGGEFFSLSRDYKSVGEKSSDGVYFSNIYN